MRLKYKINLIILCEGHKSEVSMIKCSSQIHNMEKNSTEY